MFHLLPLIAAVPINAAVCDELFESMEDAVIEEVITLEEAGRIYADCLSHEDANMTKYYYNSWVIRTPNYRYTEPSSS